MPCIISDIILDVILGMALVTTATMSSPAAAPIAGEQRGANKRQSQLTLRSCAMIWLNLVGLFSPNMFAFLGWFVIDPGLKTHGEC
jgi:hypothetical protein